LTVQPVVSDPHIRARLSVAKLDAADATLEAADVVEQPQTFDDHRGSAATEYEEASSYFIPEWDINPESLQWAYDLHFHRHLF